MSVVDLNLRQVSYLISVIDEGHFGRAADKLFISPPALTQQIRSLERKLGVELVDRSAHPLKPTLAGERFLREARAAVAAAERALETVRKEQTHLRIGFMTAAIGIQTQALFDHLRQQHRQWSIEFVELAWSEQASAVRRGTVDAAVVRPPMADDRGLRFDVLYTESRVVALPATHRLAHRQSVSVNELDDDPHVTDLDADPEWVRWWACDPRPSGKQVTYGPSVRTIGELLEVVASGQAIAITSALVPNTHRHPQVTFVPVHDVTPSPVCLCTREEDTSIKTETVRQAVRYALTDSEPEHER
ncbi:LysR family transcriptional regulator [Rhodococcus opacus]|nr:LysR family transcriptional regulator [Rhodococcus opacus]